jgi:hypothetical protein
MSIRQTALFACLVSMAFSASAHDYSCGAGTRAVVIGSFRFTQADLLQEQKMHSPETCPLPIERVASGTASTQRLQSPVSNSSQPLPAARPDSPKDYDGPPQMCGVVDGKHAQYHYTSAKTMRHCNEQAANRSTGAVAASTLKQSRKVAFRVRSPLSYNDPKHHTNYSFTDGDVVGACYVCVPIKPTGVSTPQVELIKKQETTRPKD